MAVASFAPSGGVDLSASSTSSNVAIPTAGTPVAVMVTNLGQQMAFVVLGASSVVATPAGLPILPGTQVALTIGSNTNIAAVTLAGQSTLNITAGT